MNNTNRNLLKVKKNRAEDLVNLYRYKKKQEFLKIFFGKLGK